MFVVFGSPAKDELHGYEFLCHDANNVPIYCPPSMLPFLKETNQLICNKDTLSSAFKNCEVGKQTYMLKSYIYELNRRLKERNILETDLSKSMNPIQVFARNTYDFDRTFKMVLELIRSGGVKILSAVRHCTDDPADESEYHIKEVANEAKESKQRSDQKVEEKVERKEKSPKQAKPKVVKKTGEKSKGPIQGEWSPRSEKACVVLGAVNLMILLHEGKWTRPKRLKGIPKHRIGAVSSDAVHILTMAKAIANKPPRKVPKSWYPDITVGNGKCHVRALFNIDPKQGYLAKLATEEKITHDQPARVKNLLNNDDRLSTSFLSVHRLNQEHWVALSRDTYTDDQLEYDVTNYDLGRKILIALEEKKPDMAKVQYLMAVYGVSQ